MRLYALPAIDSTFSAACLEGRARSHAPQRLANTIIRNLLVILSEEAQAERRRKTPPSSKATTGPTGNPPLYDFSGHGIVFPVIHEERDE